MSLACRARHDVAHDFGGMTGMPTYEYECRACSVHFERLQRFSDAPVQTCPECGGTVRRVLHPVGIVFKGSGWYITDSRKSDSSMVSPSDKADKGEKKDGAAGATSAKEPGSGGEQSAKVDASASSSAPKATVPSGV
jgi:putative FmdB family regulatory protein